MRYLAFLIAVTLSFGAAAEGRDCARIVSLAPSITETVFELGLGDRLVGVTRFCRYPDEAQRIEKIGGLFDLNLEKIVTLKPTHVVALEESVDVVRTLERFGIVIVPVDHRNLEGIRKSFSTIADACGVSARASAKLQELDVRERALRERLEGVPSFKILVVVGRSHEASRLSGVYVSGSDGFYFGVLSLIGATTVNPHRTIALPTVSPEGLMSLGAEAIIEIANADDSPVDVERLEAFWRQYPTIPAVARGRIGILTEDYASIPGPRYILLAERFAKIMYPDRF